MKKKKEEEEMIMGVVEGKIFLKIKMRKLKWEP